MPEFAYIARDVGGRKVAGKLSAGTQAEALALLSGQQLFPLSVEADAATVRAGRGRKVKTALLTTFYGQLADLLRSGVPLLRALEVLRKQASQPALVEVLARVQDDVKDGKPLAEAFARHPRVFGDMAVSMVRAGTEGGFLEEALERVAEFTEKQDELRGRTQGALAYPVFLGVVGAAVVAVLLVFFVPKFEGLFARLRQRGELPAMTDWLLAFSGFLRGWWLPLFIVAAALGTWLWMQLKTDAGRLKLDQWKLKIPMVSPIFINFAVARFCRVLGTMLHNGVPILRSLEISASATGNKVLAAAVGKASENISAGQSLAKPLAAGGFFPPAVVEMIAVAEESATLDTVLVRIADGLERRTWRQLDLFVRLLEPLMLLLLALVVLFLAVALLMPVIKMSSAI
ncbi:MAG: type II secretion system F family protein [Planctomycetaceae bacterium]|nr:type II secretion system F family protein [Planctomycetaceae bacterium]